MADWPNPITGLKVDQEAKKLNWMVAPDAAYKVYAFAGADETDTAKAIATAQVERSGPGRAGITNEVSFNLRELGLAAGKTYYLRVQAITKEGAGYVIPGQTTQIWGANSKLSDAVEYEPVLSPTPELPKVSVKPALASDEVTEKAEEAAAEFASDAADGWGGLVVRKGPVITVDLPEDVPTVVTLTDLPEDLDPSEITVMCVFGDDGSLTALPTRVDDDGNIVVLLTGDAVLVPFNVSATFSDIGKVVAQVKEEIEQAASFLIVEGYPGGQFRPGAQVTVRAAVTMFLRATGIPVVWETAMETGIANGFIKAGMTATAPMSRMEAANLIVNALASFGLDYELAADEVDELLTPFADMQSMSAANRGVMAICVKLGIFQGTVSGNINPNNILNRSQMASLAVRLQDVLLG